jgi:hypothetical protein
MRLPALISCIPLVFCAGYRYLFDLRSKTSSTQKKSISFFAYSGSSVASGRAGYHIFVWSAGGQTKYLITARWLVVWTTLALFEGAEGINSERVNFVGVRL